MFRGFTIPWLIFVVVWALIGAVHLHIVGTNSTPVWSSLDDHAYWLREIALPMFGLRHALVLRLKCADQLTMKVIGNGRVARDAPAAIVDAGEVVDVVAPCGTVSSGWTTPLGGSDEHAGNVGMVDRFRPPRVLPVRNARFCTLFDTRRSTSY